MISVIIPTYKDWIRLQFCLNALDKQTISKNLFEIIVVNNDPHSSPPSKLILPTNCRIIEENVPGSYAARNKALSIAKGDIIGFTDSDCIPDVNWIGNALKIFENSKNIDRIAGEVVIFREPNSSWLAWKFDSITAFDQIYNVKNGVSITANLFVKKEIFNKIGLFDNQLFSGGDIEWNKRASLSGFNIVFSKNVLVNHPARQSMMEVIRKSRRVIGGLYTIAKSNSNFAILKCCIRQLFPPIKTCSKLKSSGNSTADVMFVFFIAWFLKFISFIEILRILFGGKQIRD